MSDAEYLKLALAEAMTRRGFCAPNPAVGAVVVKNGVVLAKGRHEAAGKPHAEVEALKDLGIAAQGSTVYVTLEPCCHWGKTPPCSRYLIEKGVTRVVYGFADPNPKVSGGGGRELAQAGIATEILSLPEIAAFYESYAHWTRSGLPWVTLKLALSLDGKTALSGGRPVAITGEEARHFTHQQRLRADAILTSQKTVALDNPQLNVRLGAPVSKPLYLVDARAELSHSARCLPGNPGVTVFHGEDASAERLAALAERGIRLQKISASAAGLDLAEILLRIGQDGVHELWVEAGGALAESLLVARQVQRAYFYVAPRWLGQAAQGAFSDEVASALENARQVSWQSAGRDAIAEMEW